MPLFSTARSLGLAFVFCFFAVISNITAQQVVEDRSYFFEDREISSARHALKIDAFDLMQKEFGLLWEYRLRPRISIQFGASHILKGYNHSFWKQLGGNDAFKLDNSGWLGSFQTKFFERRGFKSPYVHLGVTSRSFPNIRTTDFVAGVGWQFLAGDRIRIDPSFSLSTCWQNSLDDITYAYNPETESWMFLTFSLAIGWVFIK